VLDELARDNLFLPGYSKGFSSPSFNVNVMAARLMISFSPKATLRSP